MKIDNSADYLETFQSIIPNNYTMDVMGLEKDVNSAMKKKLQEIELKIEKLLQKTNYKVYESDEDRLSSLDKKFIVIFKL